MFTMIITIAAVLALTAAVAVFHFADLRGYNGVGVLAVATAAALIVFGVGAAVASIVDTPRPARSACSAWKVRA